MPTHPATRALALTGSLAGVGVVAASGAAVTPRAMPWYRALDKPRWTPPDAVFGPAWSVLYAGQAVAAWLVWRGDDERDELDVPALSSYVLQLGLNLAWTLLFFGLRRPGLALVDSCVMWLAIVVTIREFGRRHRFAATLLLPYLAWVTFATALNFSVWRRNR
jgi:tryptophan-rich sensory protein